MGFMKGIRGIMGGVRAAEEGLAEANHALAGVPEPHKAFADPRTAQAKVLADEGYTMARNSPTEALQYQKYIVEVHPEDEPAFRTEVTAWVDWTARPEVGDVLTVVYEHGTHDAALDVTGDARYDWKLRKADQQAADAAKRDELLNGPVPQDPLP
jgi:hypothetical protein